MQQNSTGNDTTTSSNGLSSKQRNLMKGKQVPKKLTICLLSLVDVGDPMQKREEYAVNLRKKKTQLRIQEKRRNMMVYETSPQLSNAAQSKPSKGLLSDEIKQLAPELEMKLMKQTTESANIGQFVDAVNYLLTILQQNTSLKRKDCSEITHTC